MTSEEFFMYLIIGLIVVAPLAARLYRRATLHRTTQLLRTPAGTGANTQSDADAVRVRDRVK